MASVCAESGSTVMLTLRSALTARTCYSFIIQGTWSQESEEPANYFVIYGRRSTPHR